MTVQTIDLNGDIYIPLLKSLNVYPNEDGTLTQRFLGKETPCKIGKRVLLLPLPEVIRNLDNEKTIVFHPLAENVARADSVVQNFMKQLITMTVSFKLFVITQTLYDLACNKSLHDQLTGDQLTLLSLLPDADAKGSKNLSDVISKVDMKNVRIWNVFNKRNGKLGGSSYNRVAVVTFPLFSEILDHEKSEVWKGIRKRDAKEFKTLFDYILPGWDKLDAYSAASDSMEAPSFQALTLAYIKVAKELNNIVSVYSNFMKVDEESIADQLMVDLGYEGKISNLSKYRNVIPVLDGNAGEAVTPTSGQMVEDDVVHTPKAVAPNTMYANMANNLGVGIDAPPPPQTPQQPPVAPQMTQQPQNPYYAQQQPQQQPQRPAPGVAGFNAYTGIQQPNPYYQQPNYQQPNVSTDPVLNWNNSQMSPYPTFPHPGQPPQQMPPTNPFTTPTPPRPQGYPVMMQQQPYPPQPYGMPPNGVPGFNPYGGVPPQMPYPPTNPYPQQPNYGYPTAQMPISGVGLFNKR